MERKVIFSAVGVVVLLGAVGVAFAGSGGQLSAADPALSEDEAVQTAEDRVDGTAQSVELENEMGPVYEVTVEASDGTLTEVEVDGDSGEVLEVEQENESESEDESEDEENEASDENESEDEDDDTGGTGTQ